jgi:hypothetical protein
VTGAVGSVTGAVGSVTAAVTVTGDLSATMKTSVTTAATAATPTVTAGTVSDKTGYALTSAYDLAKTAAQDGDAMTLTSAYDPAKTAAPTIAQIWEELIASHDGVSGSMAAALHAAGSAGDPWATALPGSYGAGTAGEILGTNLDAAVSSRLASAGYTAPDNSDIAAIKSTIGTAGVGLTNLGDTRVAHLDADVSSRLATSGYTAPDNSDISAIKTQTDKLAFTVANQIDANVIDWKSATAPAMTGDAYARIGVAGAGLTALGDTRVANLDAAISTRLATSGYTAPDNADILVIKTAVGTAGAGLTNLGDSRIANLDATVSSRLATSGYTAPDNSDIIAIKSVTDGLPTFVNTAGKLWVLDGSGNPVAPASQTQAIQDKTDNLPASPADESLLTAAIAALPTAATVGAIKTQTDKFAFTVSHKVDANIHAVNDTTVNGDGSSGTPWGP